MRFYTNVQQYGNRLLVRGTNNGKTVQEKVEYKPTLWVPSRNSESTHQSLFGKPLESIKFESINEAKDYIKRYGDVDGFEIYGNTAFVYQYITEMFPGDIEFDIHQVRIFSLDIECTAEHGFPDVRSAVEEILLITLEDYASKKIVTFGARPGTAVKENHTYIQCKNERDLLKKFMEFWTAEHPHIITGWNIEFFDIPYLTNRIRRVLGEEEAKDLSPWRIVNDREVEKMGKSQLAVEIMGVNSLDYIDLYRKFTYTAQESYKLDYIAKVELGQEKLSYDEYDSFRDFYTKDFQKFIEYNVIDTELVDQLEEKMKLIELILTMAYDAKCNITDVFSAVRLWDCILYNHLWNKNIVIHQRDTSKTARQIVGAYVKEPRPGQYDWVLSFDATSLYPSIIMQYNMSPETLMPGSADITVEDLLEKNFHGTQELQEDRLCMASNGAQFSTQSEGIFPEIVKKFFDDRKKYKKQMLEAQNQYEITKQPYWKNQIAKFNNFQMARKIQMNSLYGAWANEYFRYYDARIAEGITMTGQYIIQVVGRALNTYLNKVSGTKDQDYSFYSDTDSCYVTMAGLVEKFFKDQPKAKIIKLLDKICEEKIGPVLDEACKDLADYTNAYEQKIFFKREVIADRGIWVAKKRYALNVWDSEGVTYAEPKLKVMGLEIVRSSTPEYVRDSLKEAVKICLTGSEADLQNYISKVEQDFRKLRPEQIAFPRGVNGLEKWGSSSTIYGKGTPMNVRAALLYNWHLKKLNLDKKYELIREGDKIKFLYLVVPNTIKENTIGFIGSMPREFDLDQYVDYDTMFQKAFIEPMNGIIQGIGWSATKKVSLEDLFA
jgi:DNA polymerase elongation subunit (family B)